MFELFQTWYKKKLGNPHSAALLGILLCGFGIIYFFSDLIMPLLVAIVFAYLLDTPIRVLTQKFKLPRTLSIVIVLGSTLSLLAIFITVLLPNLWNQTVGFVRDLPNMFNLLNTWLQALPEHYPELVDYAMLDTLMTSLRAKILGYGESLLTFSLNSLVSLVGLGIYAFLVPLMVFFMIKDKKELIFKFNA